MSTTDAEDAWVSKAIAEQEEYVKRWHSCGGVVGTAHRYETFRGDASVRSAEAMWRACVGCGVTETKEDYAKMLAAQKESDHGG